MNRVAELYEKVAGDAGLREKFERIMREAATDGPEATQRKLYLFAENAGYPVSIGEVRAYAAELAEVKRQGELSDAELDLVAGGKSEGGKWNIMTTVASLGAGCVLMSLIYTVGIEEKECSNMFA